MRCELGAGSCELGAGSWGLGAGSWELGVGVGVLHYALQYTHGAPRKWRSVAERGGVTDRPPTDSRTSLTHSHSLTVAHSAHSLTHCDCELL